MKIGYIAIAIYHVYCSDWTILFGWNMIVLVDITLKEINQRWKKNNSNVQSMRTVLLLVNVSTPE